MCHELARWPSASRCHKSDPLIVMVFDKAHRFGNVTVVAHHHGAIVGVEPAVVEQMHGEIDVRAFLLGPNHLRRAPTRHRLGERCPNPVTQEMPKIHLDLGPVVAKDAEVHILALRLGLVSGRLQDEHAHHAWPKEKQEPPKRPRALRSKPQGVFWVIYARLQSVPKGDTLFLGVHTLCAFLQVPIMREIHGIIPPFRLSCQIQVEIYGEQRLFRCDDLQKHCVGESKPLKRVVG